MATGRSFKRWMRVYIDGYDMSGYSRNLGPLNCIYPEIDQLSLLDAVNGMLPDDPEISPGTLNGLFDNTALTGIHAALGSAGVLRDVMVPIGIQAVPAAGNPVFMGSFSHSGYIVEAAAGDLGLNCQFGKTSPSQAMLYDQPWGVLLHADGSETDVNDQAGIDDNGAATTKGGWLMYQLLSAAGDGTIVIKIQDAATNADGSFADLSGATSGEIEETAAPTSGIIQLAKTATVRRYLRWQVVLDGITSARFLLSFVRGR